MFSFVTEHTLTAASPSYDSYRHSLKVRKICQYRIFPLCYIAYLTATPLHGSSLLYTETEPVFHRVTIKENKHPPLALSPFFHLVYLPLNKSYVYIYFGLIISSSVMNICEQPPKVETISLPSIHFTSLPSRSPVTCT